jgi:hypothetical protein
MAWPPGSLAASEGAVDRLSGSRGQALLDLLDHLGDDCTRRRPGGVGQQLVEFDEQRDQVQIGLDRLQHLRLQQELRRSRRSMASRCST